MESKRRRFRSLAKGEEKRKMLGQFLMVLFGIPLGITAICLMIGGIIGALEK